MPELDSDLIKYTGENNMPNRNGTGPAGQGPLTGRGLGPCGRGLALRRGFGRGYGGRMGFRRLDMPQTSPVTLTETEEQEILQADLKDLQQEIKAIEGRLKELK